MQEKSDFVAVGHISGAYGIKGWVRIKPYSADAEVLLNVRQWHLDKPQEHDVSVAHARWQGDDIVAQFEHISDRNGAEGLRGASIYVSRANFPPLPENEYYWVDLIGLDVFNLAGERLGFVEDMMDNVVHPILRVRVTMADGTTRESLIPFVEQYIVQVDRENKKITVDWERDY